MYRDQHTANKNYYEKNRSYTDKEIADLFYPG